MLNRINGLAGQKPRLTAGVHFARRRNNSVCAAEVLRISLLASSIGRVRTAGASVRGGVLGGVRVLMVSFSMGGLS